MDWKKHRTSFAALLAALVLGMSMVGCSGGNAAEPAVQSEPTASEVQSAAATDTTAETTATTAATETTTTESTTATTTKKTAKKTAKSTTKKTTTTKAPAETTTQAATESAAETTATAAATKKAELSEDDKLANANYWLGHAKSYAASIGMIVGDGRDGSWDAPITVESPKGTSWTKEDIEDRLSRYQREGFVYVWFWLTHDYNNEWELVIGYSK